MFVLCEDYSSVFWRAPRNSSSSCTDALALVLAENNGMQASPRIDQTIRMPLIGLCKRC